MTRHIRWGDPAKDNTLIVVRALLYLTYGELDDKKLDQSVQVEWSTSQTELEVTGRNREGKKVGTTKKDLIQLVKSTDQPIYLPKRYSSTTNTSPEKRKLEEIQNVFDCLRKLQMFKDKRSIINSPYWHFILTLKHQTVSIEDNIRYVEQRWNEHVNKGKDSQELTNFSVESYAGTICQQRVDWGEWGKAPNLDNFVGRTDEIIKLKEWIIEQHCRVVTLYGMGGIGKTTLAIKFVNGIQTNDIKNNFDKVIWRSLKNYPPLEEIMNEFIQFLYDPQEVQTNSLNIKVSKLIKALKAKRCLLVLDDFDFESIMQISSTVNYYKEFNDILRQISEIDHKSCLLLISRKEQGQIQEEQHKIVPLQGLNAQHIKSIFERQGSFSGSDDEWQELTKRYDGNPLFLKYMANAMLRNALPNNNIRINISEFMQSSDIITDIENALDGQFNHLSKLEHEIIYWLAINREPVNNQVVKNDILDVYSSNTSILSKIDSLNQRLFIEKTNKGYTLHPVLMDFITDKFIKNICQEIINGNLQLFKSHALLKTQAKDYIRSLQISLFIEPVINQLLDEYNDINALEFNLKRILSNLRNKHPKLIGYAAVNAINLLTQSSLKSNLSRSNLSSLTIRQADLRNIKLHDVNFENSHFKDCKFSNSLGSILWVVFSPDDKFIAVADANSRIHLWEINYDKNDCPVLTPYFILERSDNRNDSEGHYGWIWSLRFSPDSQYIASAGDDKTIIIWDVKNKKINQTLHGHKDTIRSLSFSQDGILASASDDGTVKLWNIKSHECICTLSPDPTEVRTRVRTVSFHPVDNRFLASAGDDKFIKIWNINTGECIQRLKGHEEIIRTISFSADGKIIASAGNDKIVIIWGLPNDAYNYKKINTLKGHEGLIRSVDFSRNGNFLVSASEDQNVKLWDARTGKFIRDLKGHTSWVQSVRFSPNGRILASGGADHTVKLWDIHKGCLITLQGYTNCVFSIAYSPDGKKLASGHEDGIIRLWDVQTDEHQELLGHTDWVRSVTFSLDGRFIASSSGDRTIRLWDLENQSKPLEFKDAHQSWIRQVRFSPNNRILASCSDDNTIKIWDRELTKNCIKTLAGHTNWVRSINFSSDKLLASASGDKTIKLWNVETGQCIQTLEGHDDWVWCVAFNSNGDVLASGCGDGTIKIWRINNYSGIWEECQVLTKHDKSVRAVAFNSDGSILASGSTDKSVCLFNTNNWECIGEPKQHQDWVRSLAFSEREILASASQDGSIHIWNLHHAQPIKTLQLPKLYHGLDISGARILDISGARELNPSEIATLKALGANRRE